MPNENRQSHLELVESLASSIHKKFLEPAEDREGVIKCEIKSLNERVSDLEKKVYLLTDRHGRTRLLTRLSLVAASLIFLGQVFLLVK